MDPQRLIRLCLRLPPRVRARASTAAALRKRPRLERSSRIFRAARFTGGKRERKQSGIGFGGAGVVKNMWGRVRRAGVRNPNSSGVGLGEESSGNQPAFARRWRFALSAAHCCTLRFASSLVRADTSPGSEPSPDWPCGQFAEREERGGARTSAEASSVGKGLSVRRETGAFAAPRQPSEPRRASRTELLCAGSRRSACARPLLVQDCKTRKHTSL